MTDLTHEHAERTGEHLSQRVLIADDDEGIRDLLVGCVHEVSPRNEAVHVPDGNQALEQLQGREFDLLVADIRMPGIEGLDLLEICRREYPYMPVVMVTGFDDGDTILHALRLGACNFVTKPFRVSEMAQVIRKALEIRVELETPRKMMEYLVQSSFVFSVPPCMEQKLGLLQIVRQRLGSMGFGDASTCQQVVTALDEALLNAMFHGCLELSAVSRGTEMELEEFRSLVDERMQSARYQQLRITMACTLTQAAATFTVSDPGRGFDWRRHMTGLGPATGGVPTSGHGILLMRTFMDSVSYVGRGNEVHLVKYARRAGV